MFVALSGAALLVVGATDRARGVALVCVVVWMASLGGAVLIRGGIRRSRGFR